VDWCLFNSGILLFTVSGGVDGVYSRTYTGSGVTYSGNADHPEDYSTHYSYTPTIIYTEKSHVLDVDLRTNSVIAEKRRAEHYPREPVLSDLTGDAAKDSTYDAELRFLGRTKTNDFLIGKLHNATIVNEQITNNGLGSLNVSEWRAQTIAHAFFPQFYQRADAYEAVAAPQLLSFGSGWYFYQSTRYWYNDAFDPNPIVIDKASLQSRFSDVIACFADKSFGNNRSPTYKAIAALSGSVFPIETHFKNALVSKGKTVGDGFNFAPIYAL
jgi:hypothetical protein